MPCAHQYSVRDNLVYFSVYTNAYNEETLETELMLIATNCTQKKVFYF